MDRLYVYAALAALTGTAAASAQQTLFWYDTSSTAIGNPPNSTSPPAVPFAYLFQQGPASIAASNFTRNPNTSGITNAPQIGITPIAFGGTAPSFGGSNFSQGSTLSLANGDYFAWTYTGYVGTSITSVQANAGRSTNGPANGDVYYAVYTGSTAPTSDSAYSLWAAGTVPSGTTSTAALVTYSGTAITVPVGSSVAFRYYAYNVASSLTASSAAGQTFRFQTTGTSPSQTQALSVLGTLDYAPDVSGTIDSTAPTSLQYSPGNVPYFGTVPVGSSFAGWSAAITGGPSGATTSLVSPGPSAAATGTLDWTNAASFANGLYSFTYSMTPIFFNGTNTYLGSVADTGTISVTLVPTPGAGAVMGLGLLAAARRRRA
jgi:hypothetical protein